MNKNIAKMRSNFSLLGVDVVRIIHLSIEIEIVYIKSESP